MSKVYKVSQVFQATVSKEDKTPKTVEINGNTFNAWKVKLDGESSKGWINVNKKPGNEIKPGDELYGDVVKVDGKFGTFYNFKSASKPMGQLSTPVEEQSSVSTDLIHDKLDYIIELLEKQDATSAKPVNLEDLDI